jgi:hypothetical protein
MQNRGLAPKLLQPLNLGFFRCPINGHGSNRMRRDRRFPAIFSAQMQETQAGIYLAQELVDSSPANRRDPETGHTGSDCSPFADCMDRESAILIKPVSRHLHRVGAGQEQGVVVAGFGWRPVQLVKLEQGNRDRIEAESLRFHDGLP